MEYWVGILITVLGSFMASSGFWLYVQKKLDRRDCNSKMLIGLGHDRIISLGIQYLDRGYVTHDELESLLDYLWTPYCELGGNGSAKKIIDDVLRLPVKNNHARRIKQEDLK